MPATFGAVGVGDSGTGTQTPQIPAGVVTGSLSAVFQGISNNGTRTGNTSGGNGTWFNELTSANANGTMYVDYKVCTSNDPAPPNTYSVPGNAIQAGAMYAVRFEGYNQADVFGASNLNAATSGTSAAVSLTGGNAPAEGACLVWVFKCQGATPTVTTPPSGFTLRTGAGANTFHIATLDNWGGGDTGSLTATMSGSTVHRTLLIAVNPAPPEEGTFTGGYAFGGATFAGISGPGEGTFTGGYAFAGSPFSGEKVAVGQFTGGYDFTGFSFVGVAGTPSAYGAFTGEYDFTGSGFVGADDEDDLIDVYGTPGGRQRFGGRK